MVVGGFVNLSATVAVLRLAARNGVDLALICAGSERQFALEDAVCAGRMLRACAKRLEEAQWSDSARATVALDRRYGRDLHACLLETTHGRALQEAGFGSDVALCATVDSHPVVPVYSERQVTRMGALTR